MLQLLLDHQQQLGRFVSAKLASQPDSGQTVDDIIQETAIKAFRNAESLKATTRAGFYAWLRSIAANLVKDVVRSDVAAKRGGNFRRVTNSPRNTQESALDLLAELSGHQHTPSQNVARREATAAIQFAIGSLPDPQRIAIQLHCLDRMTLEETAEEMGRTAASVHGLIQRAKKNLRELMLNSSKWFSRNT